LPGVARRLPALANWPEVITVPLNIEQKKAVVAEVAAVASRAHSAIAAEYSGLSVAHMTELRARARSSGVYIRVVRNTLARRAVRDTDFECLSEHLTGPLVLAFSQEDPGAAARLMKDFAKEQDKLVIRLVAIGGQLLDVSAIDRLASLPTRDEAISIVMGVMKAPIEKLARTLNEPHAKLARTIAAVCDLKQQSA
jgi:large subunit ribosomal protein L10